MEYYPEKKKIGMHSSAEKSFFFNSTFNHPNWVISVKKNYLYCLIALFLTPYFFDTLPATLKSNVAPPILKISKNVFSKSCLESFSTSTKHKKINF